MEKIKKIKFFDFDGTLVKSPLPETGKIIYQEKTGQEWPHKGWWSQPLSLDMDMFDIPSIQMVIDAYEEHRTCEETCNVMLTGRMEKLNTFVRKILDSKGLEFHEYHYNTGGSTETAKMKTISQLLKKYKYVKEVVMFDDRLEHIPIFQDFGDALVESGRLEKFEIIVVPSNNHK
jgi:hypothetical protein